jgi:hypothetical protein
VIILTIWVMCGIHPFISFLTTWFPSTRYHHALSLVTHTVTLYTFPFPVTLWRWQLPCCNIICALLGYYAASLVIVYRRFGTTYRSHIFHNLRYRFLAFFLSYPDSWRVKMAPIHCPETSVKITTRRRVITQKSADFNIAAEAWNQCCNVFERRSG